MVLWMLGLWALGFGILFYVVAWRPDAADRKRLESGSAEPEDEPVVPMTWGSCAFGCVYLCFRIIVYLIIIIAVVVGLAMLFAVIVEWTDG
jgi:hypothetical protein